MGRHLGRRVRTFHGRSCRPRNRLGTSRSPVQPWSRQGMRAGRRFARERLSTETAWSSFLRGWLLHPTASNLLLRRWTVVGLAWSQDCRRSCGGWWHRQGRAGSRRRFPRGSRPWPAGSERMGPGSRAGSERMGPGSRAGSERMGPGSRAGSERMGPGSRAMAARRLPMNQARSVIGCRLRRAAILSLRLLGARLGLARNGRRRRTYRPRGVHRRSVGEDAGVGGRRPEGSTAPMFHVKH
jgi:hypothetical protein